MKTNIFDNKRFWKTINPSLSYKLKARNRKNLFEKEESVKTESKTEEFIKKFVFNSFNNLEISKYVKYESFIGNIEDQRLRVILKNENRPGIVAI